MDGKHIPNFLGAFSNARMQWSTRTRSRKCRVEISGEMDFDFGKGLRVKQQCKAMGQSFRALYRLYSTICFGQF